MYIWPTIRNYFRFGKENPRRAWLDSFIILVIGWVQYIGILLFYKYAFGNIEESLVNYCVISISVIITMAFSLRGVSGMALFAWPAIKSFFPYSIILLTYYGVMEAGVTGQGGYYEHMHWGKEPRRELYGRYLTRTNMQNARNECGYELLSVEDDGKTSIVGYRYVE
jgi:hypothetical protein